MLYVDKKDFKLAETKPKHRVYNIDLTRLNTLHGRLNCEIGG